jgi:hypothetical protein
MSLFVYGVVDAEARPEIAPAHLGPVHNVEADGLAALCSAVEGSPLGRRRELQAHVEVLSQVCLQTSVVPLRFGVVLGDEAEVRDRLLLPHAAHLHGEINRLRDRLQFNVRLVADEKLLLADVVAGDPKLRSMVGSEVGGSGLRLGEAVATAYRTAGERVGEAVVSALAPQAEDHRIEGAGGQDAATAAAFLVERSATNAFLARADQAAASLRGRFTCRVIGPLPPFSFVTPLQREATGEAQWVS